MSSKHDDAWKDVISQAKRKGWEVKCHGVIEEDDASSNTPREVGKHAKLNTKQEDKHQHHHWCQWQVQRGSHGALGRDLKNLGSIESLDEWALELNAY